LGPYAGPFKVLEKKLSDTYRLELPENLRVHPTFHVSFLKLVARDASRPNREHTSRPPLEFEVEAVLKSRQLRGREWEYLVKWKGYHPIEAFWVNESDMEHAQEAIEEFHTRPAKKKRRETLKWVSPRDLGARHLMWPPCHPSQFNVEKKTKPRFKHWFFSPLR